MEFQPFDQQVLDLWDGGLQVKGEIARRLAIPVKRVRRILYRHGRSSPPTPQPAKLEPYQARIQEMAQQGLNQQRIYTEIRSLGYQGGRTILGDYLRSLERPSRQATTRYRRFETEPGEEIQVDWTIERVSIEGQLRVVHFFGAVLAWSRYLFMAPYRNEKLPTLLAAHVEAFTCLGGVTRRVVYDNMSTVVLGRRKREVLWNPRFLEFARHWMYSPVACRPRHPDRKGKIESPFAYHHQSFLKGSQFESWDHLEAQEKLWLQQANQRVHGTTRQVPLERWGTERLLLTPAPQTAFPTYQEETRSVYADATVSVNGVRYSVPSHLAGKTVAVRIHTRHIEILDSNGTAQARHPIQDTGLVIDVRHYMDLQRGPAPRASALQERFLRRFPGAEAFLEGLHKRMKSLTHIHTVQIERLAQIYGTDQTAQAIAHAASFANYNAKAVERILAARFPLLAVEPTHLLCSGSAAANRNLTDDETDEGSLDDYDLDQLHSNKKEDDDDNAALCAAP